MGSGMYLNEIHDLSIDTTSFKFHKAQSGGAISLENLKKLRIENSYFKENSAIEQGGAIHFSLVDLIILRNC